MIKSVFNSQDSKFYIKTALKMAFVPLIALVFVLHSLWIVMELNYRFFITQGLDNSEAFREVFFDMVLIEASENALHLLGIVPMVFLLGLVVAHLALRPFQKIKDECQNILENGELTFEVQGAEKWRPLSIAAKLLFDYLYVINNRIEDAQLEVPKSLRQKYMGRPQVDKVFLIEYTLLIAIIVLVSSFLTFTFINEVHAGLIESSLKTLRGSSQTALYLTRQDSILHALYLQSTIITVAIYIGLSKNLVKSVDGVSFAFCRDIMSVVNGDHSKRIYPRFTDPGQDAALSINECLDFIFESEPEDAIDLDQELDELPPPFIPELLKTGSD